MFYWCNSSVHVHLSRRKLDIYGGVVGLVHVVLTLLVSGNVMHFYLFYLHLNFFSPSSDGDTGCLPHFVRLARGSWRAPTNSRELHLSKSLNSESHHRLAE